MLLIQNYNSGNSKLNIPDAKEILRKRISYKIYFEYIKFFDNTIYLFY